MVRGVGTCQFQLREPRFGSCAAVSSLGRVQTLYVALVHSDKIRSAILPCVFIAVTIKHCCNVCMNEYLTIHSGGYVCTVLME